MRVAFLAPTTAKEIPPPGIPPFLMPPYWAATLVSSLPDKLKKQMEVRSPNRVCDLYFASFKVCNKEVLHGIKNLRRAYRRRNPRCLVVVGGWGPTLHPKDFSNCVDMVVTGTFNEAIGTFTELLLSWADGKVENLEGIRGIFTKETDFTGFRSPTLGKPVNWQEFCELTNSRLSDYEDKRIGFLALPLRVSPLSCPKYVNPLISNVKKGTELEIGCNLCAVAYAAERMATELESRNELSVIDDLTLNEDNFDDFFLRVRNEIVSALNQLGKENFRGKVDVYDCDDSLSSLKLELLIKLMDSEYKDKKIKDHLTITLRTTPDVLNWAVKKLEQRGLMERFGFEVEAHYASKDDLAFTNSNFGKSDLENFISSIERHRKTWFLGLFILATPKSGPKDLAENVDMVIRSIGAGIAMIGIGPWTGIGYNRLSEEYSAPDVVNAEIRPTVEEYLYCLDSWLKGEKLSSVISKHESSKEILEKIYSILGKRDQRKKSQTLSLKSALEELKNLSTHVTN